MKKNYLYKLLIKQELTVWNSYLNKIFNFYSNQFWKNIKKQPIYVNL